MTPRKMLSVVKMYEHHLNQEDIPKKQMDPGRTFKSLGDKELLSHAHFLIDDAKEYASDPKKQAKANRYLTAIQMCLSFAGWYTLEELMSHNRPL